VISFAQGIFKLVFIVLDLVIVWAAIDAAVRPAAAYGVIGHKKAYWVAGLALGVFVAWAPFIGLMVVVAAIVYLVEYKPKLQQISRGSRDW
jgi:hypothetical protein